MESSQEFNPELKEEVSKILAQLYKEIGNNRQQLTNKVLGMHREINKELNASKVDPERGKSILAEVARIVKMASQQLPHLKINLARPAAPVAPKPVMKAPKPVAAPPEKNTPPARKVEPPAKKIPAAKKSAPAKKASTPAKKTSSAKKKK